MIVKQDSITKLWAREDGAVLMPPNGRAFKRFRWMFGFKEPNGYRSVWYKGKKYAVHRLICRAFHGLPPEGKPYTDHKDRCRSSNFASNLHWVSPRENNDNIDSVDKSVETYGVRACDDRKAYSVARRLKAHAQGLTQRKGPDGKWGWYPRIRKSEVA